MLNRVTIEVVESGQPRPYADSIYRYRVLFERQNGAYNDRNAPFVPHPELDKTYVMRILQAVCKWVDNPQWWERTLNSCDMVSPGLWEVVCVEAYTD